MTDRDRDSRPIADDDLLEVRDSGETLDAALGEEEVSALAAAEDRLRSAQKDLQDLKDRHLPKIGHQ